ncbi:MAG TPA: hypothetical protein VNT52_00845 [Acidimicrobiales bacterium]|nr:hypothetical protein [Acidimicrobiales bacterium]
MEAKHTATPFAVSKDDIRNPYQLRDATEAVVHGLIGLGYGGSFARFFFTAGMTYGFRPKYDARTKAGKEFEAAEAALQEALRRYDETRAALAKATGGEKNAKS